MVNKLSIISGAGISAESGLQTFRGADGLWEGYDIMDVASIDGWRRNKELVLDFYNQRRAQLYDVKPNVAHILCAELDNYFDVSVITQNVDDLHERAGSKNIIHLHGQLLKARSEGNPDLIIDCKGDINIGDIDDDGFQMRPHIVWFGEEVPLLGKAADLVSKSDVIIIVGTSLQVYPAAGLISYADINAKIFYIDPFPSTNYELSRIKNLEVIEEKATDGMRKVVDFLLKK